MLTSRPARAYKGMQKDRINCPITLKTLNDWVSIYTLSYGDTIFYVGKTTKSLNSRFSQHKSASGKMGDMFFLHNNIKIQELDTCSLAEQVQLETFWIHQIKSWGFNLINVNQTTAKACSYRDPRDYIDSHISFTPAEIELVSGIALLGDILELSKLTDRTVESIRLYLRYSKAPLPIKNIIIGFYLKRAYEYSRLYYKAAFQ